MIWRALYSFLGILLLPLLLLRLWWRGRKNPGYREHIGERFGFYRTPPLKDVIWIHAVSVGETRAAAPLIAQLEKQFPGTPIVLTHMTATGRATGKALFGQRIANGTITQLWLPYDYRFAVRAFLAHTVPRMALLMETEVWPHVIDECRQHSIPCFLINARMSERSAKIYARFTSFTRPVFTALAGVAAQSAGDAQRLIALGANAATTTATGNLKFDFDIPPETATQGHALREQFGPQRPVWVWASTRDGEEALLLDALVRQRDHLPPDLLTVIVPRHPERFDVVAELLKARQLAFIRRSHRTSVPPETPFVLGDSMGELLVYYAAADLAFVGGSLLPFGGQNLIEPLAVGTPTLIGLHTFNFHDISKKALEQHAVRRCRTADELVSTAAELLRDANARAAMRDAGSHFIGEHRGATLRLTQWLSGFANATPAAHSVTRPTSP